MSELIKTGLFIFIAKLEKVVWLLIMGFGWPESMHGLSDARQLSWVVLLQFLSQAVELF